MFVLSYICFTLVIIPILMLKYFFILVHFQALTLFVVAEVHSQQAPSPNFAAQYHIQTNLGDDRFFRFQTHSGQYRKEILHPDGSQEGTYGWVDPNGVLRLFDYLADDQGYRIVKESLFKVGAVSPGSSLAI